MLRNITGYSFGYLDNPFQPPSINSAFRLSARGATIVSTESRARYFFLD